VSEVNCLELIEDVKVDDRVVHSTIRLATGSDDGTSELFAGVEESAFDRRLIAVSHGAEDTPKSGFRSFEVDNVESILDRLPVANEEGRFDVEWRKNPLPVDFVTARMEETDDVGSHRVCGGKKMSEKGKEEEEE
jgi:hypothetical protein